MFSKASVEMSELRMEVRGGACGVEMGSLRRRMDRSRVWRVERAARASA